MEVALRGKAKRRHLSVDQCQDLGQRAGGSSSSLTQPHVFNLRQRSNGPHRGLYPRVPPKQRKYGRSDEASEQQEEEEEEVDDSTMLAAAMETTGEGEEEEDYLQGVTSDMFDVDDDFERCVAHVHNDEEEEEVEALPDAHYGLLGSERNLEQPCGCFHDLPEEVLRQILSLLPGRDLYHSANRVCHRWRDITEDAKFVPFKKQYYRYLMREESTVRHILSVLKDSGIAPSTDHSIRHLVVLMAQHSVGERVRPEDVLQLVKKHRLFPQAESSIRLVIPDVHKYLNLNTEGPNPYAAMAVLLVLSENVGDVQSLVSLLTGCLSLMAITEYLSHMATMLLAMERQDIRISNRLHYNIYYVLHLMENGPFPVSANHSRQPDLHLTGEQQHILSHDIQRDHVVKIMAFAGTGKTTTLVKFAEQRPHLRFLYVAFNKSVSEEAKRRFPPNVDCKTVHSLAYKDIGYRYRSKLTLGVKPFPLLFVLPKGRGGYTKAKVVSTTLSAFMASTDRTINITHVPNVHVTTSHSPVVIEESEKPLFVDDAQMIWNQMKDVRVKDQDAYYMTHDGYLKLWQLQEPKPCLSHYDVLFIDEAQDCTPAILDVLMAQPSGKILVGDPHQQIYTFRGAVNALSLTPHTHIYYLTQSFRFGAEIAYVGATILQVCKGVDKILVGGKQTGGVCDANAEKAAEDLRTGVTSCSGKMAVLSRSNSSVFSTAVELTDANPHCRIHFIGDVKSFGLDRIMDMWTLMRSDQTKPRFIKDRLIRSFLKTQNPGISLKLYISQTEDHEMSAKFSIVEKYSSRIPELVLRLRDCSEPDFRKADFIVGTVHKAKGLEFNTVVVTEDFARIPQSRHNLHQLYFSLDQIPPDEWNLLYVAVTRARKTLVLSDSLRHLLTLAGEYYLTSHMADAQTDSSPPPCCITACPYCVTPGSAFIVHRPRMKCGESLTVGGPLCERCVWRRVGPMAFLMTDHVRSMSHRHMLNILNHGYFYI